MTDAMTKLTQADIDAMPIDAKLELVETIWDSIAATQDTVPVPGWHKDILDSRIADKDTTSDTWQNVRKRLDQ